MTPGRLLYLLYHRPIATLRQSAREGGPVNQWITAANRRAMVRAATALAPRPAPPDGAPEVCFLTGKRLWYQTAFCAASLDRVSGGAVRPVFFDDGSLDPATLAEIARVFPGGRIVTAGEIATRLDTHLPAARFPTLREHRKKFILLRKITDIHAGHAGWRLFLDSDMLFFRRPVAVLDWLAQPDVPIHMLDVQNAYGYSDAVLSALAGHPIPGLINTGLLGLPSHELDWERLEHWNRTLLERHGSSYFMEQALVALSLANRPIRRLASDDYRLLPDEAECRRPTSVLHHYVDLSKQGYFRYAWRHHRRG